MFWTPENFALPQRSGRALRAGFVGVMAGVWVGVMAPAAMARPPGFTPHEQPLPALQAPPSADVPVSPESVSIRERRLRWLVETYHQESVVTPRLSREERRELRRELRREVHDAGRELYPRQRRRMEWGGD